MSSLFDFYTTNNGTAARDAALDHLRIRRADLIRDCTAAALRVALDRGEVCADDVRALVPIPLDISPKLMGVVFKDLAGAGILRRDGYRSSTRKEAHARPLTVWSLIDAAGAAAWLAAEGTP